MENMIARILELDKMEQALTAEAEALRTDAQKEITAKKEQIREELLKKARIRSQKNAQLEAALLKEKIAAITEKNENRRLALEKLARENLELWAKQLAAEILA